MSNWLSKKCIVLLFCNRKTQKLKLLKTILSQQLTVCWLLSLFLESLFLSEVKCNSVQLLVLWILLSLSFVCTKITANSQLSVIVLQMSVNQYVLLTLFSEVQHKYNFWQPFYFTNIYCIKIANYRHWNTILFLFFILASSSDFSN